ncbi:hypothetical protein Syun_025123 [Stephania yunnanensis]|uniref:Caffeic acid O-methyltransferase n=1 Tax=Stephania yunnanensis TaxID=152371 RepID=A0AAP0EY61_9MAGN
MDSTNLQKSKNTSVGDDEDFLFAEQIIYVSILPMVVRAAIKLNVFEIINSATSSTADHLSASEIASLIPNNKNPDAHIILDRMLRFLASHSLLTCTINNGTTGEVERLYGLTPASKYFVKNEDGASLAPNLVSMHNERALDYWLYLDEAVLEPGFSAIDKAYGMNGYEYLANNAEESELFNQWMSDHTMIVMRKILDKYKGFDGLKVVVDVGGGVGTNINMIVSKYPIIKGINFELPHVVEVAPSFPGVEHVGGDMFASVPNGDAIFMKWVLNTWSDEQCLTLLKNCYEALPHNGKVIVVEKILSTIPEPNNATRITYATDLSMMAFSPKSKERTKTEFQELAKGSGFAGIRLACNAYNFWVIEFLK